MNLCLRCMVILSLAALIPATWTGSGVAVPVGATWQAIAQRVQQFVPRDTLAVLESHGEFALAWQALEQRLQKLGGRSPRPQRALVQRGLRLLLRQRADEQALVFLQRYGRELPQLDRQLLRAVVGLRMSEPDSALAALEQLHTVPQPLRGYALHLRAEAEYGLGQWTAARTTAHAALEASLCAALRRRMRLLDAQAALQLGETNALRAVATQLLRDAEHTDASGLVLVELCRASFAGPDTTQIRAWLMELLEARPAAAESAYAFLERLHQAQQSPPTSADELKLARYEMSAGARPKARARLEALLQRAGTRPREVDAEAWALVAETYEKQQNYNACLDIVQKHRKGSAGTPSEAEMLRLKARSLLRSGDEDGAVDAYRDLARRFPTHPRADDALYEVGWRHEIRRDFDAAERVYASLPTTFPNSPLADDALLRQALCALRDSRLDEALSLLSALTVRFPESPLLARALYWRLWIDERRGQNVRADALRSRLRQEFPASYFAVLATQPSGRNTVAAPPPRLDALALAVELDRKYTTALGVLRASPNIAVPPRFASESQLWTFLLDYGLDVHATSEMERLLERYANDAGALLELLARTYERGATEHLVRLSYQLGLRVPARELQDEIEIVRYPALFCVTLATESQRNNLSHATVLGIIRQESAFSTRVDSRAGARGLMQVMPAVGTQLARELRLPSFRIDQLYEPQTNLRLGCHLLAAELQQAQQQLPVALAAYNAGSVPAATWLRRLAPQDPPEMYLDVAEYYETRTYLERVLGGAEVYRRLYDLP